MGFDGDRRFGWLQKLISKINPFINTINYSKSQGDRHRHLVKLLTLNPYKLDPESSHGE